MAKLIMPAVMLNDCNRQGDGYDYSPLWQELCLNLEEIEEKITKNLQERLNITKKYRFWRYLKQELASCGSPVEVVTFTYKADSLPEVLSKVILPVLRACFPKLGYKVLPERNLISGNELDEPSD